MMLPPLSHIIYAITGYLVPQNLPIIVIDLAEDYSYALVGEPCRKYFWVLSRTESLDGALVDSLVQKAGDLGFDITQIVRRDATQC